MTKEKTQQEKDQDRDGQSPLTEMHLVDIKTRNTVLGAVSRADRVQRPRGHLAEEPLVRVHKAGAGAASVRAELVGRVVRPVVEDDGVAVPFDGGTFLVLLLLLLPAVVVVVVVVLLGASSSSSLLLVVVGRENDTGGRRLELRTRDKFDFSWWYRFRSRLWF